VKIIEKSIGNMAMRCGAEISLDSFGAFGDIRREFQPNGEVRPALNKRPGFLFVRGRMTGEAARLRQSLNHQLVAALAADFEAGGAEAVKRLREKDPAGYLRAIAAAAADAQPLDTAWSGLTDADVASGLTILREVIRARAGDDGRAGSQAGHEPARTLPPVP
jgi:hypothetical protein